MSTYRELIYIVSDLAKQLNDDTTINENHIAFLLNKYRMYLLKQKYGKDYSQNIPIEAFQTICVDLKENNFSSQCVDSCLIDDAEDKYLKSIKKVPSIFNINLVRVATNNIFKSSIAFISPERMGYVGNNKWLKNVIYSTIYYDNYLYLKSANLNLYKKIDNNLVYNKVYLSAIFDDPIQAFNMKHCTGDVCTEEECLKEYSYLDIQFPIEGALETQLIALTLNEVINASYRPNDNTNNAKDDLADLASYVSQYMKKNKQQNTDA